MVLVTGGFGYLGGRLATHLAAQPDTRVVLGSRRAKPAPTWLPEAGTVAIDWNSAASLEPACAGVDVVMHLAGMNAGDCAADPAAALEANGRATKRLVDAAVRCGVRRVIYVSTAHVYASPLVGTITEQSGTRGPHPYATSHLAGEEAVRAATAAGAIDGVVVRLSNGYGPPMHVGADCWMLLLNDLCRQAVTSHAMVVRTTGLQRRDFVPLTDVCRALAHLANVPASALGEGLFNITGEWAPTVWEIAQLVQQRCAAVLGFTPTLTRQEPAPGETSADLHMPIDALRAAGFTPQADRVGEIDALLNFCDRAQAQGG